MIKNPLPAPLRFVFTVALTSCLTLLVSQKAVAQVVTANVVNISNAGGTNSINFDDTNSATNPEFSIFTNSNIFCIDTDSADGGGISAFSINSRAQTGTLSLRNTGVGIGGVAIPDSALHIFSTGGPPFADARIHAQHAGTSQPREMMLLENNGGVGMRMLDTSNGSSFMVENVTGSYEIANTNPGKVNFRILPNAPSNIFNLAGNGVGIGTSAPATTLHVLADGTTALGTASIRAEITNAFPVATRNLLQLRNNGPMNIDFRDTSTPTPGNYQVQASSARFSIQDNGNQRAGMVLFNDGAIRFVANGLPNFTVTGNGNLNVVGSAPGGGNLNVGLGSNIGPSDGNLFVKRNITYGGQLLGPSDRNIKENLQEIDPREILEKVANLPITRWNYTTDEQKAEHIGPMAQDFMAAFKVGTSDKHINLMDTAGISLAAIQGLSQVVDAKEAKIESQAREIAKLKTLHAKEVGELKAALKEQADAIARLQEGLQQLEANVFTGSK